ncbi:MAG: 30S ribosomal protein S2 [Planctomycetota bacterium]|nr:30S ribosomal protein S2 [Planctomycetota bacterium]
MSTVQFKELLEAGVHFGHRVSRRHPRMDPYIFGKQNFISIINLRETIRGMLEAAHYLKTVASRGENVLFVGTKRQAKNVIRDEARRAEIAYVSERWLGGSMTNFSVVKSRIERLEELEAMEADGRMDRMGKKQVSSLNRERRKIKRNLDGIRKLNGPPDCVVIVDPRREYNCLAECRKLKIPVIAILDTDSDPTPIDIPIPANDDAMRSVHVILSFLADAIMEGVKQYESGLSAKERVEANREKEAKKEEVVDSTPVPEASPETVSAVAEIATAPATESVEAPAPVDSEPSPQSNPEKTES